MEIQGMREENVQAATRVVGLLLATFTFGLLMYGTIFLWILFGIG
jgi:uncharacterized membrane protein